MIVFSTKSAISDFSMREKGSLLIFKFVFSMVLNFFLVVRLLFNCCCRVAPLFWNISTAVEMLETGENCKHDRGNVSNAVFHVLLPDLCVVFATKISFLELNCFKWSAFFEAQAASVCFHGISVLVFELKSCFFISKHFHCREFNFHVLFASSTAVEMFFTGKGFSVFFSFFIVWQM